MSTPPRVAEWDSLATLAESRGQGLHQKAEWQEVALRFFKSELVWLSDEQRKPISVQQWVALERYRTALRAEMAAWREAMAS